MDTIPIEMIVPNLTATARSALVEADVIIGVDTASQREFTVFGTPALESTMSLKRLSAMRVVRVTLDCSNKELERLIALVRGIKGPELYQGTDE
jgi:hypothetical protein